jgi:transaldolase
MKKNPLIDLEAMGQSIWIDFISRGVLTSGDLQQWINEDGVSGITSNPSIFEKAITQTNDYDDAINALVTAGKNKVEIFKTITVEDIQNTADLLFPVYLKTKGRDGYVSLEVSPHLAKDTPGTIVEARQLWLAVDRPNVMIKVPGTLEGLPAIQKLISEGININITLLFGLPRYQAVANAYLAGLETRLAQGKPIDQIASVASFFLSRIDVLVDAQLDRLMDGIDVDKKKLAKAIQGQVAIASAKVAYEMFEKTKGSSRFQALANQGAHPQRLLWASTSTKNPAYSDVKYIEPLIGPETINTLPLETLTAYRDHGNPKASIKNGILEAHQVLDDLKTYGIDIASVTQQLEIEGIDKFNQAYDQLLVRLSEKSKVFQK